MNTPELRETLNQLDGATADELETEKLEFKSWKRSDSHKRKMQIVRETVVGFANARGGTLILGVSDNTRTKSEAIHGVGNLDIDNLRREIYDGTDPHILVDIDEAFEKDARVVSIRVPPGIPPHTTSEGLAKIRVGKHTQPLSGTLLARLVIGSGSRDQTSEILNGVGIDALDPDQIELLRRDIRAEGTNPELANLPTPELLGALNLISGSDLTLAAVLLLGKQLEIIRHAPQHELIFVRFEDQTSYNFRRDFRDSILETLSALRILFEANHRVTTVETDGFRHLELPDFSWLVVREAVLNALMHRDYFLHQSIHVNLHRDCVEVVSPGGFIGGVTPLNVLRHDPVRRNPLLASALQAIGLVNRVGLGVDRIYDELLRHGKSLPRYEVNESFVRLTIPTTTHSDFARFAADTARRGEQLDRDDLIVLRSLITRGEHDRWSAARVLQLSDQEASNILVSLRQRGFLDVNGRGRGATYRLSGGYAHWEEYDPIATGRARDRDEARSIVLAAISDQGAVTNTNIRELTGYSRSEVLRLTMEMRMDGTIEVRGSKRGAHYVRSTKVMNREP